MAMWNPLSWATDYFTGKSTNARNGWKTAAVWYGLNRISGNVGVLDLDLKQYNEDGTIENVETGISWSTLRKRPSPIYGPLTFKQTMTAQALWWGNGRAAIIRNGRQSELIILDPARTETGMVNGEKWHVTYANYDNDTPENRLQLFDVMERNPEYVVSIPDSEVLHIQGFGNGVCGVPLFQAARTSLESMLGADSRSNDQINRGFVAKVMLSAPENSPQFRSQEQADEFIKDFTHKHGEDGLKAQVGLLRGGVTASTMQTMNNDEAQFLETRKFLRQDAALWFLLESMLGDNESESYSSLEQRQLSYLLNCLSTWLERWEEECDYKMLTPSQFYSGRYRHQFNIEDLLKTSASQQADIDIKYINGRVWNPNEVRHRQGKDPYKGGDEYLNPAIDIAGGSTSKDAGGSGKETSTGKASSSTRQLSTPEAIQKVYLGVGKVVTSDEARQIVNDDTGTDLAIPGPQFTPQSAQAEEPTEASSENAAVTNRVNHMIGIEEKQVNNRLKRGDSFESLQEWYGKFENNLGNVLESLGGNREDATAHCKSSLKYLSKQPKEFRLNGSADLLTEKILKGSNV